MSEYLVTSKGVIHFRNFVFHSCRHTDKGQEACDSPSDGVVYVEPGTTKRRPVNPRDPAMGSRSIITSPSNIPIMNSRNSREDLYVRIYGNVEVPTAISEHSSNFTFGEVASPTDSLASLASPLWSSNVPIIEPHHRIDVTYPALNSLQWKERPLLHTPLNAAERYEPLPLINDIEVQRNSGRDLKEQTPFFSMYPASLERPAEGVMLCGDICKDMRELSRYIGITTLNVLIYNTEETAQPWIRICSGTTFRRVGGARSDGRKDYNIPLQEFLAKRDHSRWYQDILHLIEMRDDRAARHVQIRLREYVDNRDADHVTELYQKFAASFKPKRQPDYDLYLYQDRFLASDRTKSTSLFKSKKQCMICKKSLNTSTHVGIAFPCSPEHVAGRSCVRELCHRSLPEHVQCPQCNVCLFDSQALDHLRFGVWEGRYEDDPRFTEYENFEKSCADLDMDVPSRSRHTPSFSLIVHPQLFMAIWYRMIFFGSLEMSLAHVEAISAPEFNILERAIEKHVRRLDGVQTTTRILEWWLGLAIFQAFDHPFHAAGLGKYLPRHLPTFAREEEFFRPGFQRFCERAFLRTLRFLELRTCTCEDEKRIHSHGGRMFYNPGLYTNVWTQERLESYDWQRTEEGRAYLGEFRAEKHRKEGEILLLFA